MLIFLYGEDTYRSYQKTEELKAKFKRDVDPSGLALSVFDGAELDVAGLALQLASGGGLFSTKKMIIIKNLMMKGKKAIKDKVSEIMTNDPPTGDPPKGDKLQMTNSEIVVVIWEQGVPDKREAIFKVCGQAQYVAEFAALEGIKLSQWVAAECKKQGIGISMQAQQLLESFIGSNLWQITQEIHKLKSVVREQGRMEIVSEDVQALVQSTFNQDVFALMDALSTHNAGQTFTLLSRHVDQGAETLYVLAMVARQLRILSVVKDACAQGKHNQQEIARDLKLHPFVVQKAVAQAKNYSWEQLKAVYARLVEVDAWSKSTPLDGGELLYLLVGKSVLLNTKSSQ